MVKRQGKVLSLHLIMRESEKIKKIRENTLIWKEAGTFVPARMKKKNIYKKDLPSFCIIIYPKNMDKL